MKVRLLIILCHLFTPLMADAQDSSEIFRIENLSPPPTVNAPQVWWSHFGYKKLDSLVKVALEGNYSIQVYQRRMRLAGAKVQRARSILYPQIDSQTGYTKQQLSGNRPTGLSSNVSAPQTVISNYTLGLSLNYEVDYLGKWLNTAKASDLEFMASKERLEYAKLQITVYVAQTFFNLITLNTELNILNNTLKTRTDNVRLNTIRFEKGLASDIDVQRAKSELAFAEVQLTINKQTKRQLEIALAVLCAIPPEKFSGLSNTIIYSPSILSSTHDTNTYVKQRQDIKELEDLKKAAQLRLKYQKKELLPSLKLQGAYGYLSIRRQTLIQNKSATWFGGIALTMPLFEGFKKRSELKIARENFLIIDRQLQEKKLNAKGQIEHSISNDEYLKEQFESQKKLLTSAKQSADLAHTLYLKGLVTYLEVIDADRVVLNAQRTLAKLIGQQLSNAVELIRSKGGNL